MVRMTAISGPEVMPLFNGRFKAPKIDREAGQGAVRGVREAEASAVARQAGNWHKPGRCHDGMRIELTEAPAL